MSPMRWPPWRVKSNAFETARGAFGSGTSVPSVVLGPESRRTNDAEPLFVRDADREEGDPKTQNGEDGEGESSEEVPSLSVPGGHEDLDGGDGKERHHGVQESRTPGHATVPGIPLGEEEDPGNDEQHEQHRNRSVSEAERSQCPRGPAARSD